MQRCLRLEEWDELGEERLEGKVFVIYWRLGQRRKGDTASFSAAELRTRLGEIR